MKHLVQYIRENKRPVGAMVAVKNHKGQVMVSWSKVKTGYDTFSKKAAKLEALKKINNGNAYEIKNNIYLCMGEAKQLPYIFEQKKDGKSFADIFVERVSNYYNNVKSEKVKNDDNDTLKSDGDYIVYISPEKSVCGQVCLSKKHETYDSNQKYYYNFNKNQWEYTAKNCWMSLEQMREYLKKYNIKEYNSKII